MHKDETGTTSPAKGAEPVGFHIEPAAEAVVQFWRKAGPAKWFAKDEVFDEEFRQRFQPLHFSAARRECEHWLGDPYASLALLILLDQFPRNAFRNTGHMFATDSLARFYARGMIASGFINEIEPLLQGFVCVPFMHSESLEDQEYCLDLYRRYAPDDMRWAIEHHDIIKRFGRFPHRNAQLGRITTSQEQSFLDSGGFAG